MSKKRKPKPVFVLLCALVVVGLLTFASLFFYLLIAERSVPAPDSADAIVVLGAQVKEDGSPSIQLEWRLEKALEQYQKSPCPIVCCGAQGSNEPAPEGEVMCAWLTARGVAPEHAIPETQSVNTKQNLAYAKEKLGENTQRIIIVTSDYHLPRALMIAKDLGLEASGIGSPIKHDIFSWSKNHIRETLALGKYFLLKLVGR